MSELVTPTTELEAVNQMLSAIGESPVATLEDDIVVDAAMARTTLRAFMRELQSPGWNWNTDEEFIFTPNADNQIIFPANVAFIDPSPAANKNYVARGNRLYDKTNKTYTITESVKCDVIWFLPYNEMPEAARLYCLCLAAITFGDDQMGDEATHTFTQQRAVRALTQLKDQEGDSRDNNILSGSASVRRAIFRRSSNFWRV